MDQLKRCHVYVFNMTKFDILCFKFDQGTEKGKVSCSLHLLHRNFHGKHYTQKRTKRAGAQGGQDLQRATACNDDLLCCHVQRITVVSYMRNMMTSFVVTYKEYFVSRFWINGLTLIYLAHVIINKDKN